MKQTRLGKTGLMVSRIGLGGIPIQRLSEEEAVAVVQRCLDLGLTFVDTANTYPTSEERIGRAIGGRRKGVILATKTGARDGEGARKHLELSLERLAVDHIDLYQFHAVNDFTAYEQILARGGAMETFQEALRSGTIGHIGITSHSPDVAREAIRSGQFETLMFHLNFVAREAADELIPLAEAEDVGFIAMKPLAGGMLERADLAIKYVLQFPSVVPIVGIEKVEEIEEIVTLVEQGEGLSEGEWQEVELLRRELGTRFCRRCQYCQPCPQEVPIPMVMTIESLWKRVSPEVFFTGWPAEVVEKARACTQCGDCEEKCPYDLPIRDMIEERVAFYDSRKREHSPTLTLWGEEKPSGPLLF